MERIELNGGWYFLAEKQSAAEKKVEMYNADDCLFATGVMMEPHLSAQELRGDVAVTSSADECAWEVVRMCVSSPQSEYDKKAPGIIQRHIDAAVKGYDVRLDALTAEVRWLHAEVLRRDVLLRKCGMRLFDAISGLGELRLKVDGDKSWLDWSLEKIREANDTTAEAFAAVGKSGALAQQKQEGGE